MTTRRTTVRDLGSPNRRVRRDELSVLSRCGWDGGVGSEDMQSEADETLEDLRNRAAEDGIGRDRLRPERPWGWVGSETECARGRILRNGASSMLP